MLDILHSIVAFIVALGILVTFHEFGHYWVARKCDVKILRFAVGFGKPLWKKVSGKDKTEFVVAAIPLGGYVKMLDEREGNVAAEELSRAFNNKPLRQRVAIVLAGPLFNFIFAITAYWLVFMIGVTGLKPVIGEVPAKKTVAQVDLQAGDEIISVDGTPTATWNTVINTIITKVVTGDSVELLVKDRHSQTREVNLDVGQISIDEMAKGELLAKLGLYPFQVPLPVIVDEVISGEAAQRAGIKKGDEITTINGMPVSDWQQFVEIIAGSANTTLDVRIKRHDDDKSVTLTPRQKALADGRAVGFVGLKPAGLSTDSEFVATESYSVLTALQKGLSKTADMSLMTLRVLGKILTGQASLKNLSGPISIAQYAGKTAQLGIVAFLGFLAIISISLGVLNLLPVPVLDGGHLFYYLIEAVKGSPLSENMQTIGQQIGLVLLLGLMCVAFYNDILRLVE